MASHYLSLNRGKSGFASVDFTTGTSSASTDHVELRVLDGAGLTKLDLVSALEAFERFVNDPKRMATAGIDVSG